MGSRASSRYMAAAAASSAAASLPRPRHRAAATAVASVTRTISSAKARSSSVLAGASDTSVPPYPQAILCYVADRVTHSLSQFFDADHLRLLIDMAIALDCRKRLADRGFGGVMRDHDNGGRRTLMRAVESRQLGARPALYDAFDGDALVRHAAGDGGKGAGAVVDRQPDIVTALVPAHLRLLVGLQRFGLGAERRQDQPACDIDQVARHRGRGGPAAGAGADQHHVADEIAVDGDAVLHAVNLGDRCMFRHHGRVHALLDAAIGAQRHAEQLDTVAEIAGRLDVGGRDLFDTLDING